MISLGPRSLKMSVGSCTPTPLIFYFDCLCLVILKDQEGLWGPWTLNKADSEFKHRFLIQCHCYVTHCRWCNVTQTKRKSFRGAALAWPRDRGRRLWASLRNCRPRVRMEKNLPTGLRKGGQALDPSMGDPQANIGPEAFREPRRPRR